MAEFKYQEPFPIENDTTVYRLLTKDYVKTKLMQTSLFTCAPLICKN